MYTYGIGYKDWLVSDLQRKRIYLLLNLEIAKLAVKVLKSGRIFVFFVGHIILNEVFNMFHEFSLNNNNHLKYWRTFAIKQSGQHQKVYPRYVFAEWKPLLWYVKGERSNDLMISNTIGDL